MNCIDEIQELTENTIALYAKKIKRHLPRSSFMSTWFVLDLKRAAFKMTHIKHRVSRTITIADINRTWCRTMNDQMALEEGWKNEPLKELYPNQAHINHPTKWLEMLGNVLRLIRDVNGVPLAAVILKRLIPPPDNEDMAFGPRHSKYISHDDEMIERAPILDKKRI